MMLEKLSIFVLIAIIITINENCVRGSERCVNGKFDSEVCSCYQCYTGPTCELIKNKPPIFVNSSYRISVTGQTINNDALVKVTANDDDKCSDCGCGKIVYSILDEFAKEIFNINSETGELRLQPDKSAPQNQYSFVIKSTNKSPFDNTYDTATVFINPEKVPEPILERHRRDTSPAKVTLTLLQTFPVENLTIINFGQRLSFTIVISFPVGPSLVNLELFSSETSIDAAMMICDVNITSVGSDLQVSNSITVSKQEGKDGGVWPYTHIVFSPMNVINNKPSPASISTVQVVITFDAVMLYSQNVSEGGTYYVSAGAEYVNGTEIWVGQVGYNLTLTTPNTPQVNTITGDSQIYPGRITVMDFTILAPYAYMFLNLIVSTPLNNTAALSLCVAYRNYVGTSFSCLPVNYNQPSLSSISINNQNFYTRATMNLGTLTNRYYKEPSHTDPMERTITLKIVARVNPLIWLSSYYAMGFTITNNLGTIYNGFQSMMAMAAPPLNPYTTAIPWNITYDKTKSTVNIGDSGRIVVTIVIPAGTELDFSVNAKFQDYKSEICGVTFLYAGMNVPCVDQMNLSTTYVMTPDNYAVEGTTTIPGIKHVNLSNNANDNILQVYVTFRPINDSRNSATNTITGLIKLNWTGATPQDLTIPYTLGAAVVIDLINSSFPNFTFALKQNDGNVSISQSYQLYFGMRLQPGVLYSPTTLGFYMPFNNTVRVGMCSVAIQFVGKRVLCFNPSFLISKFIYSSKINDTKNYDQLLIPIGSLCSSGPPGDPATIDDEIQIVITLLILPHVMNVIGDTTNLNAGMMISPKQIWVANQLLKFITPATLGDLGAGNYPTIIGQRVDAPNYIIFQNDLAVIQYLIKIAPARWTSLSLKISTDLSQTNGFGVCQILIKSQGASIPCINGVITNTTWGPFSKYNKEASFKFPNILNTGTTPLVDSAAFDDNSIMVEVVVKFGGNLVSTPINVIATLDSNTNTKSVSLPFTLQTTLSRFNGTPLGVEPIFTMYLSPLFNDTKPNVSTVAYSESLRGVVVVQLRPAIFQSLKIIVASAPDIFNQMDVVQVNILSVGRNIPCLQTGMILFVIQQRTSSLSSDMTSVDMGTVCQRQTLPNTTIEDDKIYIEAVFRVWKNPASSPTSLQLNTIALLNNDQVYVARIIFSSSALTTNVFDFNLLNQTIVITASASTLNVNIGAIFLINATIVVPPYTQFRSGMIIVYSENPPGTDSYYFVNGNVNFTGTFGKNIGINVNEPMPVTFKSTKNTTQMDYICADLGVVQNTATTYRMGQANYTSPGSIDDTMNVQMSVRLTDNSLTSNGNVINLVIGARFGSLSTNTTLKVTVVRTNQETIDLNVTTVLMSTKSTYVGGDTVMVSAQSVMTPGSTLECRNFTIYIASPVFMAYSGLINSSYSSVGYSIVQTNLTQGGFYFIVPYYFYNESISVIFTMSLQSSFNLTRSRSDSLVTIPVIYACQTLNWPSNPLGNKWFNKVQNIAFSVKGNEVKVSSQNCDGNLGLSDSTVIKNCAISAFMSPYPTNDVTKIRSNSGSYWIPHVRSGQYSKLRYVDIKFGKLTTVSKAVITSPLANKPILISVYGTMDGRAFSFYKIIPLAFTGNVANAVFQSPPFSFRGIRISFTNATTNDDQMGINIDLFGCLTANITDSKTFDPCNVTSFSKPVVQLPDFYYRGYLNGLTYIFVCDEIATRTNVLDTYPRCFRYNTALSSYTWEDLGNQVGKIVGFDQTNLNIYAISSDLNSYIVSEDNGLTWITLNAGGWQSIKGLNTNLIFPTSLPWTSDTQFSPGIIGNSCTRYRAGTLFVCYDGIYAGVTSIYTWNDCCSS